MFGTMCIHGMSGCVASEMSSLGSCTGDALQGSRCCSARCCLNAAWTLRKVRGGMRQHSYFQTTIRRSQDFCGKPMCLLLGNSHMHVVQEANSSHPSPLLGFLANAVWQDGPEDTRAPLPEARYKVRQPACRWSAGKYKPRCHAHDPLRRRRKLSFEVAAPYKQAVGC